MSFEEDDTAGPSDIAPPGSPATEVAGVVSGAENEPVDTVSSWARDAPTDRFAPIAEATVPAPGSVAPPPPTERLPLSPPPLSALPLNPAPIVQGPPTIPAATPVPSSAVRPVPDSSGFPLGGVAPWGTAVAGSAPSSPPYATPAAPPAARVPTGPPLPPPSQPLGGYSSNDEHFTMRPARPSSSLRQLLLGVLVGSIVASLIAAGVYLTWGRSERTVVTAASTATRPSSTIKPGSLDIQALLKRVRPSVVSIKTDLAGRGEAAGSGIVVSSDGMVLTNAHVIANAQTISVMFADGSTHAADLVGSFPDNDVAIVKARDVSGSVPAELGSSDALLVGDDVVAIGNALNLGADPSVTKGIVSAKERSIDAENGEHLEHLIQTDAAINPGNSGGPLVNAAGQVVGVNTAIIASSQNVGFSLAIDPLKPLIEQMKSGKGAINQETGFLGVSTTDISEQPSDVLSTWGVQSDRGAFVTDVQSGTAADAAGLHPGDVIIGIDGKAINGKEDLGSVIRGYKAGDTIKIDITRLGERQTLSAQLKRRGG